MSRYSRYKTIRFESDVWQLIEIGARADKVNTSEYIRRCVEDTVAKIDIKQALQEAS